MERAPSFNSSVYCAPDSAVFAMRADADADANADAGLSLSSACVVIHKRVER